MADPLTFREFVGWIMYAALLWLRRLVMAVGWQYRTVKR